MPIPSRCSAEFLEGKLNEPICVGCGGFVPDGVSGRSGGKAPRKMWATIPRIESPAISVGARPSNPPPVVDGHGRMFGGNWSAVAAAKRINRADENSPDLSEAAAFGFFDGDEW